MAYLVVLLEYRTAIVRMKAQGLALPEKDSVLENISPRGKFKIFDWETPTLLHYFLRQGVDFGKPLLRSGCCL
jgi:hypothetical protein